MSLCTSNLLRITYVIHYNRMKEEILPLNALRFLAALAVLCVHFFVTLIDRGYLPHFLSFLNPYTEYGYLGVNLFFLISGFVISLRSVYFCAHHTTLPCILVMCFYNDTFYFLINPRTYFYLSVPS